MAGAGVNPMGAGVSSIVGMGLSVGAGGAVGSLQNMWAAGHWMNPWKPTTLRMSAFPAALDRGQRAVMPLTLMSN